MSDPTEAYDHGRNFGWYRQIGSLRDYILVDQKGPLIGHFRKQRDGDWRMRDYGSLESAVCIDSLQITILTSEIYRGVDLST